MAIVSGSLRINSSVRQTRTVGLGTSSITINPSNLSVTWSDGDVVNGIQIQYSANDLAIQGSGGSATSWDLVASLLDPLSGTAQTYTKIKMIIIRNNTTTAGANLKVNGNFITTVVLGGTTPYFLVGPGGLYLNVNPSAAGWAVTATTGDIITLQGEAVTNVTADIHIAGVGTVA